MFLFKICHFKENSLAENITDLKEILARQYQGEKVSVKYISFSGMVGVSFCSVSSIGFSDTYTQKPIDFDFLAKLAIKPWPTV